MQKPSWYFHRLRVMQPREVLHRGATTIGDFLDLLPDPLDRFGPSWHDPWQTPQGRHAVRFPCDPEQVLPLLRQDQDLQAEVTAYADTLCRHRFSLFELQEVDLGPHIDWHRNCRDNRQVSRKPSLFLDYRDPHTAGDVKCVWELNRQQHLVPLALAFLLTGEAKYSTEVREQLLSWISQNPCGKGINWCSALECGLRLISWSWVFYLLKAGHMDLPEAFFAAIGRHCRFILRHLSLYSSGGNHLIGEAAGLYIASVLFARKPHRSRWEEQARGILLQQIRKQVYPDGAQKELSLAYHRFATELFLLPALVARANGLEFPAFYWDRLRAMFTYLRELRDAGGRHPDLGDNDSGHCLFFQPPGRGQADSLLTTAALLFDDARFLRHSERLDAKSLLLLGEAAPGKFLNLRSRCRGLRESSSRAFPDAGTVVLKSRDEAWGEVFLVFDGGPMGLEPLAGHGHADTLSFFLSLGGKPIFIDPGTYTYRTGDPWRAYFRGTSAHNTVRIDQEDQAVPAGPFLWIGPAKGHMIEYDLGTANGQRVRASHDGYGRLRDPVRHTREMRLDAENRRILITDQFESRDRHLAEFFFHLDPTCEVFCEANTLKIQQGNRRLTLALDARLKVAIFSGCEEPILGWYSPAYGRKQPTHTVVGSCWFSGSELFLTQILLGETSPPGLPCR